MTSLRKALSALVCLGLTLASVPGASAQVVSQAVQPVAGVPSSVGLAGVALQPAGLSGSLAGPSAVGLCAPNALPGLVALPSPSVTLSRPASVAAAVQSAAGLQAVSAARQISAVQAPRAQAPSVVSLAVQAMTPAAAAAKPTAAPAGEARQGTAQAKESMAVAAAILKEPGRQASASARSESSRGSWDRFWSGSAKARADEADAVDESAPAASRTLRNGLRPFAGDTEQATAERTREKGTSSRTQPTAIAGGIVTAGAMTMPTWLSHALHAGLPYAKGAGVLAATWGVTRLASWGLEKLWQGRNWDRNILIVTRMAANVVLWLAGATVALKVAGMDWSTLLTGLGVGTLAVSMSVRKVIGNFIYGIMLLADRPFRIGERLKIGDTEYTVKDMTFRYIVLEQAPGSHALMDYSQLAGKPLRLYRKLESRDRSVSVDQGTDGKKEPGAGLLKWAIVAAAASALGGGGWLAFTGLEVLKPYVLGGAALAVSWVLARVSDRVLRRMAARHGWDPTLRSLLQMAASAVIYVGGLLAGLSLMGVSWSALLAGAGVLSAGVTIAATDMVSNLLEAGWILLSQPFRVGDRIKVGDQEGTVVDMTLRNVVLQVEENGRTDTILLPYSLVGGSTLTVFKDYIKTR